MIPILRWLSFVWLSLPLTTQPALADDTEGDGWEDESGWEDLDDHPKPQPDTRPMVMGPHLLPPGDLGLRFSAGMQYFNAGDMARSRPLLEEACRRVPDSVPFAIDLCKILFEAKDYDGLQRVATPFYRDKKNYEFAQYLGDSAQALGRYGEAIDFYKDYLTYFGTNLLVLNAMGDCYVKTGDLAGAITVWRRSLDLNANQPELKKKLADVQDKIKIQESR